MAPKRLPTRARRTGTPRTAPETTDAGPSSEPDTVETARGPGAVAAHWVAVVGVVVALPFAVEGWWKLCVVLLGLAAGTAGAVGFDRRLSRRLRTACLVAAGVLAAVLATTSVFSPSATRPPADAGMPILPPAGEPSARPLPLSSATASNPPIDPTPSPARDTFSVASRPSTVTLDALTDSDYGDERQFVQIRPKGGGDEAWTDRVVVRPGEVYEISVYYSNSARDASATGARVRLAFPGVITGQGAGFAYLSADNASPREISSAIVMTGASRDDEFVVRYVADSATLVSLSAVNGTHLPDEVFLGGVPLGCAALDGLLPAGDTCAGRVQFAVRIDKPNFDMALLGADLAADPKGYADAVPARVGSAVRLRAEYTNTGSTQLDDVSIGMHLPAGLRYVPGSSVYANSRTDAEWRPLSDDWVEHGFNAGDYAPDGNVYIRFDVMVEQPLLDDDGNAWLKLDNLVTATTSAGTKGASLTFVRTP